MAVLVTNLRPESVNNVSYPYDPPAYGSTVGVPNWRQPRYVHPVDAAALGNWFPVPAPLPQFGFRQGLAGSSEDAPPWVLKLVREIEEAGGEVWLANQIQGINLDIIDLRNQAAIAREYSIDYPYWGTWGAEREQTIEELVALSVQLQQIDRVFYQGQAPVAAAVPGQPTLGLAPLVWAVVVVAGAAMTTVVAIEVVRQHYSSAKLTELMGEWKSCVDANGVDACKWIEKAAEKAAEGPSTTNVWMWAVLGGAAALGVFWWVQKRRGT